MSAGGGSLTRVKVVTVEVEESGSGFAQDIMNEADEAEEELEQEPARRWLASFEFFFF